MALALYKGRGEGREARANQNNPRIQKMRIGGEHKRRGCVLEPREGGERRDLIVRGMRGGMGRG